MGEMRMKIRSWTGAEWDAIVLGLGGLSLRVAISGWDDAAELWCFDGHWFDGNGDPVEIECAGFPPADDSPLSRALTASAFPTVSDSRWAN